MLWLYNNLNQNRLCDFFQIFTEYNLVYSDGGHNDIYSFDIVNPINSSNSKFNYTTYEYDNVECEIKMIDNIISYNISNNNLNTNLNNKQYVFTFKTNFVEPNDNQHKLPIFNNVYKLTNTKRLPNLIETEYNFTSTLNFEIFKLDKNNNIQFIIETNPITNSIRKYFITTNLNLVQEFL